MNYIRELRAFHDAQQTRRLDANAKLLWHELMYICNTAGWPEWFDVWSSTLTEHTGLNRSTLGRARDALVNLGYIEIRHNGTKATSFKILSQVRNYDEIYAVQETVQEPTQEAIQEAEQEMEQEAVQEAVQEAGHILKEKENENENENKNNILSPLNPPVEEPKKTEKTAKKTVRDVFEEYAGENLELLQALRDYEQHRVKLGKRLTSYMAELRLKELDRLGGNDTELKISLIRQTIDRGWQSFYELKDERPKAAEKPPDAKKEMASRYDFAEIRRRDRERLKRLAEEEI